MTHQSIGIAVDARKQRHRTLCVIASLREITYTGFFQRFIFENFIQRVCQNIDACVLLFSLLIKIQHCLVQQLLYIFFLLKMLLVSSNNFITQQAHIGERHSHAATRKRMSHIERIANQYRTLLHSWVGRHTVVGHKLHFVFFQCRFECRVHRSGQLRTHQLAQIIFQRLTSAGRFTARIIS